MDLERSPLRPLLAQGLSLGRRFLRWWLGELAFLVPESVRARFARHSEAVLVEFSGTEITVTRRAGAKRRPIARLPLPERVRGGQTPASLPRRQLAAADEVVLRLPSEAALRKTLNLPLAAEANLREILYFELDRQTPFRPDEVYFDYRVLDALPGSQRLIVELTVLARSVADPILAWLARWGLEPTRVEDAGRAGDGWTCRLPARERAGDGERTVLGRFVNPALALLALLLAGTAVYLPILRAEAELTDLQAELAAETRRAEETMGLRETLASLSDEALHLVNKKSSNAPVLEIWSEVTRVMPDHSFAFELRVRERQVELVGQSKAATGLLQVIESSPLFYQASFRSPITRNQDSEAERFHLAFEVRRREPDQRAAR